jgi:osmotically-inducible protein OsmY
MMKKCAVAAVAVWSLTATGAFAQTTTAEQKTEHAATQAANSVSDASITPAVKTRLTADKTVGGLKIDVDTNHGVVTLSGPVRSAAERSQAVRLARNTKGVTRVVDNLTIDATAATSGHAAADTSKRRSPRPTFGRTRPTGPCLWLSLPGL